MRSIDKIAIFNKVYFVLQFVVKRFIRRRIIYMSSWIILTEYFSPAIKRRTELLLHSYEKKKTGWYQISRLSSRIRPSHIIAFSAALWQLLTTVCLYDAVTLSFFHRRCNEIFITIDRERIDSRVLLNYKIVARISSIIEVN